MGRKRPIIYVVIWEYKHPPRKSREVGFKASIEKKEKY